MKKLMFAAIAVLSFTIVAEEAAPVAAEAAAPVAADAQSVSAVEAKPKAPRRGGRGARRAMQRSGAGDMMGDPAVWAVINPRVAEKLGLSEEVRAEIKRIDSDNRAKMRDLQQKSMVVLEKQSKLMDEPKIDEAAVMASIDELFEIRKEITKTQVRRVIEVKALLTPEQLARASEELNAVHEERRSQRHKAPKAAPSPEASAQAAEEKPADAK